MNKLTTYQQQKLEGEIERRRIEKKCRSNSKLWTRLNLYYTELIEINNKQTTMSFYACFRIHSNKTATAAAEQRTIMMMNPLK